MAYWSTTMQNVWLSLVIGITLSGVFALWLTVAAQLSLIVVNDSSLLRVYM